MGDSGCSGAIKGGTASVGVFVDESAETIVQRARAANLTLVQLHGDRAREALPDLPEDMKVIYVVQCSPDGVVQTPAPSELQGGENTRQVRPFLSTVAILENPISR